MRCNKVERILGEDVDWWDTVRHWADPPIARYTVGVCGLGFPLLISFDAKNCGQAYLQPYRPFMCAGYTIYEQIIVYRTPRRHGPELFCRSRCVRRSYSPHDLFQYRGFNLAQLMTSRQKSGFADFMPLYSA